MITESSFAKNKIIEYAKEIESVFNKHRISNTKIYNLEISIFNGMFLIRKLIESHKISDHISQKKIKIKAYKIIKKNESVNYKFNEKYYDVKNPQNKNISLKNLTNQFIHSFHCVMEPFSYAEEKDIIIYFCSDYDKGKELYSILASQLKEEFYNIGNNYPQEMIIKKYEKSIDFEIK